MAKAKKPASLGGQLKSAIEGSGLSVYAVAKGSGVGHPILFRFLSGQRDLRLATASKLAAYFQMTLTPAKAPRQEKP